MGVLSEVLQSIYSSGEKYTVIQLLNAFIKAVDEYEAVIPENYTVHTVKIEETMFMTFASVNTITVGYDSLTALLASRKFIPVHGYYARIVDGESVEEIPYGLYYNNGTPVLQFMSGYEINLYDLDYVDYMDN